MQGIALMSMWHMRSKLLYTAVLSWLPIAKWQWHISKWFRPCTGWLHVFPLWQKKIPSPSLQCLHLSEHLSYIMTLHGLHNHMVFRCSIKVALLEENWTLPAYVWNSKTQPRSHDNMGSLRRNQPVIVETSIHLDKPCKESRGSGHLKTQPKPRSNLQLDDWLARHWILGVVCTKTMDDLFSFQSSCHWDHFSGSKHWSDVRWQSLARNAKVRREGRRACAVRSWRQPSSCWMTPGTDS